MTDFLVGFKKLFNEIPILYIEILVLIYKINTGLNLNLILQ